MPSPLFLLLLLILLQRHNSRGGGTAAVGVVVRGVSSEFYCGAVTVMSCHFV